MATIYALLHEDGGAFGVSFPDFPGVISSADSADDAFRRGADALTFHVAGMVEDDDPLPRIRTFDELRADPDFLDDAEGATVALIPFDLPAKAIRLNITMDETLASAVDRAAKAHGQSRSSFLAEGARRLLRSDDW